MIEPLLVFPGWRAVGEFQYHRTAAAASRRRSSWLPQASSCAVIRVGAADRSSSGARCGPMAASPVTREAEVRFAVFLFLWVSGRAIEFACRNVKGAEQGGELAVEVDAHLGDRGEAEGGDLGAGLVGGEERSVTGAGVDDGAQRHVQHNRRVVPVHLLGDGVVAHEVGGAPRG